MIQFLITTRTQCWGTSDPKLENSSITIQHVEGAARQMVVRNDWEI